MLLHDLPVRVDRLFLLAQNLEAAAGLVMGLRLPMWIAVAIGRLDEVPDGLGVLLLSEVDLADHEPRPSGHLAVRLRSHGLIERQGVVRFSQVLLGPAL